jgi:hypothetical protein
MPPDSPTLASAALLLLVALFTVLRGRGLYLRFAATLLAAMALAVLAEPRVTGLAPAASLAVLPLAGAALGLCAIARFARPLPPLIASLLLVAALGGGVMALFGGGLAPVLLPPALGGMVIAVASVSRGAGLAAMSGLLLAASAPALLARGLSAPALLLLAASLAGLALQKRASSTRVRRTGAA